MTVPNAENLSERFNRLGDVPDLFLYRANFVSLYDNDTIAVDIDLGFGVILQRQIFRLWGLDYDSRKRAKASRAYSLAALALHVGSTETGSFRDKEYPASIYIRCHKDRSGKFGRWLAEIFVLEAISMDRAGAPLETRWINFNRRLVEAGHARMET